MKQVQKYDTYAWFAGRWTKQRRRPLTAQECGDELAKSSYRLLFVPHGQETPDRIWAEMCGIDPDEIMPSMLPQTR